MSRQTAYPIAELKDSGPTFFKLELTSEEMEGIASDLELSHLAKCRFDGQIEPQGRKNWKLTAKLGATATQPCALTNAPVKTRIDTEIELLYVKDIEQPDEDSVTQMDENDDLTEAMPEVIDLLHVVSEMIALNVPTYPRADGAEFENQVFAPPGVTPITDQDLKPFASLADLKEKLEKGE